MKITITYEHNEDSDVEIEDWDIVDGFLYLRYNDKIKQYINTKHIVYFIVEEE